MAQTGTVGAVLGAAVDEDSVVGGGWSGVRARHEDPEGDAVVRTVLNVASGGLCSRREDCGVGLLV